jgi:hypothetical protein
MGCRLFESLGRLPFLQTLEYDDFQDHTYLCLSRLKRMCAVVVHCSLARNDIGGVLATRLSQALKTSISLRALR